MAKFLDFKTIYGRLGNHPGQLSGDQAIALFEQGMRCPPGSSIVEYGPDGGRSTVILAAVARNLGGQLYVMTNWVAAAPGVEGWFQRAVVTHQLKPPLVIFDPPELPDAALTVARGFGATTLKTGKVLLLGNADANGRTPIERGQGWALYAAEPEEAVLVANEIR